MIRSGGRRWRPGLSVILLLVAGSLDAETEPEESMAALNPPAVAPKIGRPVRIVSLSFHQQSLEKIVAAVDREAAAGLDLVALPEAWPGQTPETLEGPTTTAMRELARKHQTYLVSPIYRLENGRRYNSSILIGRQGEIVGIYNKVYPFWEEFLLDPPTEVGEEAPVFSTDFGKVGLAICFDCNFNEVWQRLADQGAELVIWSSAYSGGTSLQAHALNYHYYIVTSTLTQDCIVYDITGEEILYEKGNGLQVTRITLDLDRGIYHQNYQIPEKLDRLLAEHGDEVTLEKYMEREAWCVLRATKPGVSARTLARQYGMEELRDYLARSRRQIDRQRGFPFATKILPLPENRP